jgi:uncharacterized protein YjbI with pentapeptide repeats
VDEQHYLDRNAATALLKSSVEKWNICRQIHPDWKPVPSSTHEPADFTGACLCGANLADVNLSGANLCGADPAGASFDRKEMDDLRMN